MRLAVTDFPPYIHLSNNKGRLPRHSRDGLRTKEGRPALRMKFTKHENNPTLWMAADFCDRGSLTFAHGPAHTPLNLKGEQQCRP